MRKVFVIAISLVLGLAFAQNGKSFLTYEESRVSKVYISTSDSGIDYFIRGQIATIGETAILTIMPFVVTDDESYVSCIRYRFLGLQQQTPVYKYTETLVKYIPSKSFLDSARSRDAATIAKAIDLPCYKDAGVEIAREEEVVYIPSGVDFFIPGISGMAKITLGKLLTSVTFSPLR